MEKNVKHDPELTEEQINGKFFNQKLEKFQSLSHFIPKIDSKI